MAAAETSAPLTYGNWRRPASAGLLGLGRIGTMILMGGLIFAIFVTMIAGLLRGMVVLVVLTAFLYAVVRKDRHGRSTLWRAAVRLEWMRARFTGSNLYRSGPLGSVAWGTYQLPGLAAPLRLSEHADGLGRRFALLACPSTQTCTVVLATEPDGASLVDADQVDSWVADWGHWLANLGDEPGMVAASVTIETVPDTGSRLRREIDSNLDPKAPAFARQMLEEVRETYPSGGSGIRAWVAVTFQAASRATGHRRDADEVGKDLASRLPGLGRSLQSTGAGSARPVDAAEMCEIVREAYDPIAGPIIDEAHATGSGVEMDWTNVGPAATETTWDTYRHDSGWSRSWAMSTAPRGTVQSGVLYRLLAPHPDVARKRVTLVYRPVDAARAAAIVEADLAAAQFRATSTDRPSARDQLSTRAAAATAAEEAAGAGLENFGMLVTATVAERTDLPAAAAAIDNLSATARLRLRVCYGSQDSAFAASLPLGLVLPRHLSGVAMMKDEL